MNYELCIMYDKRTNVYYPLLLKEGRFVPLAIWTNRGGYNAKIKLFYLNTITAPSGYRQ